MAGITELVNKYSKLLLNPHNYKIFVLEGPQIGGIGSERGKKTDAEGQRTRGGWEKGRTEEGIELCYNLKQLQCPSSPASHITQSMDINVDFVLSYPNARENMCRLKENVFPLPWFP